MSNLDWLGKESPSKDSCHNVARIRSKGIEKRVLVSLLKN